MKRSYLKDWAGHVALVSVVGSLVLSAAAAPAIARTGPSYGGGSDINNDTAYEGRNQWGVRAGYSISTSGTKTVTSALRDSYSFCAAIDRQEYLVDCLGEQLAEIAAAIPETGDYAQAKKILQEASGKLRRLARANASPSMPPIRVSGTVKGKKITTRPLTPVRRERVKSVNQQAAQILQEAETKLLRSAETSDRRLIAYAQMAKAVGSNKTLLRSA